LPWYWVVIVLACTIPFFLACSEAEIWIRARRHPVIVKLVSRNQYEAGDIYWDGDEAYTIKHVHSSTMLGLRRYDTTATALERVAGWVGFESRDGTFLVLLMATLAIQTLIKTII